MFEFLAGMAFTILLELAVGGAAILWLRKKLAGIKLL
jgi:hypothetical protein